jgi:magnesium-transporting ATPase (P-type)
MFSKRVYVIKQFKHAAFSKMDVLTVILIWTFCLLADILVFFVIRKPSSTIDLETNLCFLFDPMKKLVDHYDRIAVGVFVIVVNICGLAVLTGCSMFLAKKLWVSQHGSAGQSSTKETSNFGLSKLFILIICIFSSWFPLLILYMFTLSTHKIDRRIATWFVVLTMPISGIINPIFHTILKNKKNNLSKAPAIEGFPQNV